MAETPALGAAEQGTVMFSVRGIHPEIMHHLLAPNLPTSAMLVFCSAGCMYAASRPGSHGSTTAAIVGAASSSTFLIAMLPA